MSLILLLWLAGCAGEGPDATDADGDGSPSDVDCDDARADVFPGAVEVCNGIDDDCDASVDEEDATDVTVFFADTDGDGAGDRDIWVLACSAPAGFVAEGNDCDDTDGTAFPDAPEFCDGVDDDCDGGIDEDAVDQIAWYGDQDGDGAGLETDVVIACTAPSGYAAVSGDCDDADPLRAPTLPETCDHIDNDCNDVVDDDAADATFWYTDGDHDGFGGAGIEACTRPEGTTTVSGDCDDANPDIYPAAPEHCDTVDEDCDGTADNDAVDAAAWYTDGDGDSYGDAGAPTFACTQPGGTIATGGDCDDADAAVSPAATEVCGDGLDNDCDGGPGPCSLSGDLPVTSADATVSYNGGNGYLAAHLSAGDLDGDGVDELLASADIGNGSLYVFRSVSGARTDEDAWFHIDASGMASAVGWGSTVMDLTGDGVGDLIVGSAYDSTLGYSAGGAYLWAGPLSGSATLATATAFLGSSTDSTAIGSRIRHGDFDGDGQEDVLLGSYYGTEEVIFRGPVSASTTTAWATLTDSWAGMAAGVGDIDGDGMDDVVSGFGDGSGTAKSVYVTYGVTAGTADLSATADVIFRDTGSTGYFGQDVMAEADLDGDGRNDVVVGSPWTGSLSRCGVAYVVTSAPASGTIYLDTSADYALSGSVENQGLGQSLAHGDLDGNGREDLIVGSTNGSGAVPSVEVYYNLTDSVPGFALTDSVGGALGNAVTTGDFDGDGQTDLAAGDSGTDDGAYWAAGTAYILFGGGL